MVVNSQSPPNYERPKNVTILPYLFTLTLASRSDRDEP
jgi:hypothetical protein